MRSPGELLEAPNRTMKTRKVFPCSAALVPIFVGAFPCSVALVFRFGGNRSMVQHGLNEGIKKIYQTNAILHIFNLSARRERPTSGSRRTKLVKKALKMNIWCDRQGSSVASTWGGPFFCVHKVGVLVELQTCPKTS